MPETVFLADVSLSTDAGQESLFLACQSFSQTPSGGVAPSFTTPPAVTGSAQVGQTLTSTTGIATGTPTPSITLKWQIGSQSDGSDMADIPAATGATYLIVAGDAGKYLRSVATATNSEGSASANSNIVGPVSAPVAFKPWYASQRSAIIGSGVR